MVRHFVQGLPINHRCKRCQKLHHTLLHLEAEDDNIQDSTIDTSAHNLGDTSKNSVMADATIGVRPHMLLMTSYVIVEAPDGTSVRARALLDSASSASFVSEKLTQSLKLSRTSQSTHISDVAGLTHKSLVQSITNFRISSTHLPHLTAIVVPCVTWPATLSHCNGPGLESSNKPLANRPSLWKPQQGQSYTRCVDVFGEIMKEGRQTGPPQSPVAFELSLGWFLQGRGILH